MKAHLLALAAFLAAAGAGVYFVNFTDGTVSRFSGSFGGLEVVDKKQCVVTACNAAQCVAANNILADAGSSDTTRFVECPVRLGPRGRALAADAGVTLSLRPDGGPALYQQVKLVALRHVRPDGGLSFGIPVDDAGWPVYTVSTSPHSCAWRPLGVAAALCKRTDGGDPGAENTLKAGEFAGAGCLLKPCFEMAGDSSAP